MEETGEEVAGEEVIKIGLIREGEAGAGSERAATSYLAKLPIN